MPEKDVLIHGKGETPLINMANVNITSNNNLSCASAAEA